MLMIRLTDRTDTRRPQFDVICEQLTATPTAIAVHGVASVTSVTTAGNGPERAGEFMATADFEGGGLLLTPEDWSVRAVASTTWPVLRRPRG